MVRITSSARDLENARYLRPYRGKNELRWELNYFRRRDPEIDPQVTDEAMDPRPTSKICRISPVRIIKALSPPFFGKEKYRGGFEDDFTIFTQYCGFAYVLRSRRHIKLDAVTTLQSVIAGGHTREYNDALNAWYALK